MTTRTRPGPGPGQAATTEKATRPTTTRLPPAEEVRVSDLVVGLDPHQPRFSDGQMKKASKTNSQSDSQNEDDGAFISVI